MNGGWRFGRRQLLPDIDRGQLVKFTVRIFTSAASSTSITTVSSLASSTDFSVASNTVI